MIKKMAISSNAASSQATGGEAAVNKKGEKELRYKQLLALGAGVGVLTLIPEMALAANFNLNAGVTAATTPLITALTEHWGKGVLISGAGNAIIGEGDGWQRATRAVKGCIAGGAAVLALIAMLG